MKVRVLVILLALAAFLAPSRSSAQGCVGVMTGNTYSSYVTYGLSASNAAGPYTITKTVLVDGSATIHPSPYCNLSGTFHYGVVTNTLGSATGSTWGPHVCPACYISVQNTLQIAGALDITYLDDFSASADCSFAGTLFSSIRGGGNIKLGATNFILENWDASNCYYMRWCPNGDQNCSCKYSTFTAYGGNNSTTRCVQHQYAWEFTLVVDGACESVGISFLTSFPINCR
jgi:hypothetical protein